MLDLFWVFSGTWRGVRSIKVTPTKGRPRGPWGGTVTEVMDDVFTAGRGSRRAAFLSLITEAFIFKQNQRVTLMMESF